MDLTEWACAIWWSALGAVLFQVPALDTPTVAAAAVPLATVSMIACVLPSHRAASISPLEAMASD